MDQNADPEIIASDVKALDRAEYAQQANDVKDQLPSDLKRQADLASEKEPHHGYQLYTHRHTWLPVTRRVGSEI